MTSNADVIAQFGAANRPENRTTKTPPVRVRTSAYTTADGSSAQGTLTGIRLGKQLPFAVRLDSGKTIHVESIEAIENGYHETGWEEA